MGKLTAILGLLLMVVLLAASYVYLNGLMSTPEAQAVWWIPTASRMLPLIITLFGCAFGFLILLTTPEMLQNK